MTPIRAIAGSVAALIAVLVAQWVWISPRVMTYGEYRVLVLAAIPTVVICLCANWVDGGRREE